MITKANLEIFLDKFTVLTNTRNVDQNSPSSATRNATIDKCESIWSSGAKILQPTGWYNC